MTKLNTNDESIMAESLVACATKSRVTSDQVLTMISSSVLQGHSFFEACAIVHQQIQCEHKASFALSKVKRSLSNRKRRLFVDTLLSTKRQLVPTAV